MATRGRRPKPTELHRLHGTLNVTKHVRDRGREPKAEGDLLAEPPPGLTPGQAEAWLYAVTHAPKGVMRAIDKAVLFVWVVSEDLHRQAAEAQATTSLLLKTPHSELPIQSPYIPIINRQALIMLKAASELGFTPVSRPRVFAAGAMPGAALPDDDGGTLADLLMTEPDIEPSIN
jgi:phage terminase small subunit